MKLFAIQTRTLFCLVLLIGFCEVTTVSLAQEKTPQDLSTVSETGKIAEVDPFSDDIDFHPLEDIKFDVSFSEPISVEEFIIFLREQTKGQINFIVPSDARNVMIPSLELKDISAGYALLAMKVATREEVYSDDIGEGLISVRRDSIISLKVFDVSHIVSRNDQAKTSMLSAIEIGLKLNDSSLENVSLKFHEETKLLFIRASDSDLDVVIQVLEQLGGKALRNAKKD